MGLEHTTDDGFLWSPNALKSSSLESKLERLHADRTIGCNFSLSTLLKNIRSFIKQFVIFFFKLAVLYFRVIQSHLGVLSLQGDNVPTNIPPRFWGMSIDCIGHQWT